MIKKRIINFFSLLIFVSLFFYVHTVFSQTATTTTIDLSKIFDSNTGLPVGVEEQVSITQIPKIPKPGQTVSIKLESYLTNLYKAKITWKQDGKVLTSETGAVSYQVQAPASGKTSTIVITITKENGGTISKNITLSPADVDLIYEADTYAHPFYKGKKLFTSESVVRFIALPDFVIGGKVVPASNLVYTWKVNGKVQAASSGYGKNIFSLKGTLIERPIQIEVNVSALNSNLIASHSITVQSLLGEVLLYENNPLLGIVYENSISGEYVLNRYELDFEAVPYFFDVITKDSNDLRYSWSINDVKVKTKLPQENYLVLQNTNNQDGRAFIEVQVQHIKNILQNSSAQFELNFKKVENQTNNEAVTF